MGHQIYVATTSVGRVEPCSQLRVDFCVFKKPGAYDNSKAVRGTLMWIETHAFVA